MIARLLIAAINEATLFVANAADVDGARDEASTGIDLMIGSLGA